MSFGGWGLADGKALCWLDLWALDRHLQIWGEHRWMQWGVTGLCSQTSLGLNLCLMELRR